MIANKNVKNVYFDILLEKLKSFSCTFAQVLALLNLFEN